MKKIFKKFKLRDLIFTILGVVIGGSIGITATTYVLQSSEIQYTSDKSVQQAIDELYTLAENVGGSVKTLPIGDIIYTGPKIIVSYTGSYQNVTCVYGVDENYGNNGTISNNSCIFIGTIPNQTLYYKIVAIANNTGKVYEYSGNVTTGTCVNFDDNNTCITATTYTTGDAIKLGGYNWHVIGDTGTNLTLLMDANQLGSNSNMVHTSSSGATYSWKNSQIRTYLNGTFLTNLQNKINNHIVSTEICADPSTNDRSTTYGGYLMSELTALEKTSSCATKVTDKVRLITYSEYYNMSPYYTSTSSNYPNVENITKISSSSDYASWLYCSSSACGCSTYGYWWTMGSYNGQYTKHNQFAYYVYSNGSFNGVYSDGNNDSFTAGVRPVITIVK